MRARIVGQASSWCLVVAMAVGVGLFGPRAVAAAEWESLGPDGGSIAALAADPTDGRVLYAATIGGLFRSTNGGRRWSPIGSALEAMPAVVAVDPFARNVVLAGTARGIYRSTDAGATWATSSPGPADGFAIATLRFSSRRRNVVLALGTNFVSAGPTNPPYRVLRSLDGGKSWSRTSDGLPVSAAWFDLAPDAFDADLWYLASSQGLYRSRDSGRSWRAEALGSRIVERIVPDPWRAGRVWALIGGQYGWDSEIRLSTDGGFHWQPRGPNDEPVAFAHLEVDPARRDHLYVSTSAALWLTADAGRSWRQVLSRPVAALVADRATGAVTAALADAELARSLDGATWKILPVPGLRARVLEGVAAGGNGAVWAVERSAREAWFSHDGGAAWVHSAPLDGLVDPETLVADPEAADVAYVGTSSGLLRTVDGASSWEPIGPPGSDYSQSVYAVGVDPAQISRLYVANQAGLYRTTDGGDDWQLLAPFPGATPRVLTLASGTPPSVFVNNPYYPTPHTTPDQVLRSTDEGATWSMLLAVQGVKAIVVDPSDARRIWVAHFHDDYIPQLAEGGIARSADGGATRTDVPFRGPDLALVDLVLDPNDSDALYAATYTGVLASHDGGATWRSISAGLRGTNVQALAIRSGAPSTLYAATTGGVFALALDAATD